MPPCQSPRRLPPPNLDRENDELSQPLLSPPAVCDVEIDNRAPFEASQLSGDDNFQQDDESFGGGVA
jgi:hypothetical protein